MFLPNAKSLFEFKHNTPSIGKSISLATFKSLFKDVQHLTPGTSGPLHKPFVGMDGWQGLCTRPLPHIKETTPENYFDQIFSNFDPLYDNTGCRVFK